MLKNVNDLGREGSVYGKETLKSSSLLCLDWLHGRSENGR